MTSPFSVETAILEIARGRSPVLEAKSTLFEATMGWPPTAWKQSPPSSAYGQKSFSSKDKAAFAYGINQLERQMISLVELVLQAFYGAVRRANQDLEPREARYELPANPPSIEHMTITAPGVDVSVELRDLAHDRRTTHVTRYRISPAKKTRMVSFIILDPLIREMNRKLYFSLDDPNLIVALKGFREQMAEALIDRAERAYINRRKS